MMTSNERVSTRWTELLDKLSAITAFTSDGEVVLVGKIDSTQDFIITCLVTRWLGHRVGVCKEPGSTIDEILAAGGVLYRPARQSIYNTMSKLSRNHVILRVGREFQVDERAVLQYFAFKFPKGR
jgi:hypothetical protein